MDIHLLLQILRKSICFNVLIYLNLAVLNIVHSQQQLKATCDALTKMSKKAHSRIGECQLNEFCTTLECTGVYVFNVVGIKAKSIETETRLTLNPCSMPTSAHLYAKAKTSPHPLVNTYIITNYRYDHPNKDYGYIRLVFEHTKRGIKIAVYQKVRTDSKEVTLVPLSEIPLACPEDFQDPQIKPLTVIPRTIPPLNIPGEHSKSNRLARQRSLNVKPFTDNIVAEITTSPSRSYSRPTSNKKEFTYAYQRSDDYNNADRIYDTNSYDDHHSSSKYVKTTNNYNQFQQVHSKKHKPPKSNEEAYSATEDRQHTYFQSKNFPYDFSRQTSTGQESSLGDPGLNFQKESGSTSTDIKDDITSEPYLSNQNAQSQTSTIEFQEENTSTDASTGYKTMPLAILVFHVCITYLLLK